jgi:acyl-coenzyme A synthetase/AMP-(fatty) acid ligase
MSMLSLSDLLVGDTTNDHVVAMRGTEVLSLGRLRSEVAHNARRIRTRGTRHALLVCEDTYQFVVGMLALVHAGSEIVLPANAQPGTLASLSSGFDLIVSDASRDGISNVLVLESGNAGDTLYPYPSSHMRIDFFTSGSTGTPKRIEKTLSLLEREALALEQNWGKQLGSAHVVGTVTHQHIYGLAFRVIWPLATGRSFCSRVHSNWEELIAQLPPAAVIVSSPAHLSRLAGLPPISPANQPCMVFSAGAPLPATAASDAKRIFGIEPTEIFGSTETGAVAFRWAGDESPAWQPLPGIEVNSREGLLHVRSPFASGAGWCALADRVVLDDNRFRLEGRADRIVKIEGKRVSLPELERTIAQLRWVEDAAVTAMPPSGSYLGAVVVLSIEGKHALARLGKFRFERVLRSDLAFTQEAAALPRRWRFVTEIPVDAMGKRRCNELEVLLESRVQE